LRIAAGEHLLSAGQTARALSLFAEISPEAAPLLKAKASAARRALLAQRLRGGFGWKTRSPDAVELEAALVPEAMRAVGSALWLMDPVRGAALIARAGRQATRLGEPTQVAIGMSQEAVGAAMAGNRRRSRALVEEAMVAAGPAIREPLLRALLDGYEGIALYYGGSFRAAAEKLAVPEEHKDVVALTSWRLGTFRLLRLWALRDAGLYGELIQLVEVWSREAARRRDAFTAAALARVGVTAWMARDDPGSAVRKLEGAKWTPPWPGYLPLDWAETLARANLALYQREGGQLRARFHKPLGAVPGWLLRGSQLARCRTWFLRGRLALMDGSMGGDPRSAQAEAAQMARSLEGERVGYASAWALFLRAGVAYQKMDFNRSALRLREAIAAADQVGMAHYAVAGRRRLGELIGGEEGASLVRQANEALGRQGVKNPKKLSDALVPGLRT
jgi:eukaryotic-like serine/threonine-protein kinase